MVFLHFCVSFCVTGCDERFFSRLQTEAIHPDCALVVQHMKAEEECYQILKQEENNHSAKTGQPVF